MHAPGSNAAGTPGQPGGTPPRTRSRTRRILRTLAWILGILIVLLGILVGVVLYILANLDSPSIAGWVQDTLRDDVGLEAEYDELSIKPFSGMHAAGLVVAATQPYAAHGPNLATIEQLDVTWSFGDLLGDQPRIADVRIKGLHLVVVMDENGDTSIDGLVARMDEVSPPDPDEPPPGPELLSHILEDALPDLAIASLVATDVTIEIVQIEGGLSSGREEAERRPDEVSDQQDGKQVEPGTAVFRAVLADLCMNGTLSAHPGELDAKASLGPCGDKPSHVTVLTGPGASPGVTPGAPEPGRAELDVDLRGTLTTPGPTTVAFDLTCDLAGKSPLPGAELPDQLFRTKTRVTFDADKDRTLVHVDEFVGLEGIVTAEVVAELQDRLSDGEFIPNVERAVGQVAAEKLARALPFAFEGIELSGAAMDYEIVKLAIDPDSGLITSGDARVHATIDHARIDQDGQEIAIDSGLFHAEAKFVGPQEGRFDVEMRVASLGAVLPASPEETRPEDATGSGEAAAPTDIDLTMAGFSLVMTGRDLAINVDEPLASRATIDVTGEIAAADVVMASDGLEDRIAIREATLENTIIGAPEFAIRGRLPIEQLSMTQGVPGKPMAGKRAAKKAPGPSTEVNGLEVAWRLAPARPAGGSGEAVIPSWPAEGQVVVQLPSLELRDRGQRIKVGDATATVDVLARSETSFDARLTMPVPRLEARLPDGMAVALRDTEVAVAARDMELIESGDSMLARGRVSLTSTLPRMSLRTPELRALGQELGFSVEAVLDGSEDLVAPDGLSGDVPIGQLDVRDAKTGEKVISIAGGAMRWGVQDLALHPVDPMQTRATVIVDGRLARISLAGSDEPLAVPAYRAQLTSQGSRKVYDADVTLTVRTRPPRDPDDDGQREVAEIRTGVKARADLRAPRVELSWSAGGPRGPELSASAEAGYSRGDREATFKLAFSGKRLAIIGKFLPPEIREQHRIDWKTLELSGKGDGRIRDVIVKLIDGIEPVLADDPLAVARGEQSFEIILSGLDYRTRTPVEPVEPVENETVGSRAGRAGGSRDADDGQDPVATIEQAVAMPKLVLVFRASQDAGPLDASLAVDVPAVTVTQDERVIEVVGIEQRARVSSTAALNAGRLDLAMTTKVKRVDQDFVGYPVRNATVSLRGHVDHLAAIRLEELKVDNAAGGTHLTATMAIDILGDRLAALAAAPGDATPGDATPVTADLSLPGRQALTLAGTLKQDLSKVALGPGAPTMRGSVKVPFLVESGDLTAFLVDTRTELIGVHASLPAEQIAIEGASGVIPVLVEVALLPDGTPRLLQGLQENVYSRTRFLDVHPFLRGDHSLAVDRIKVKGETIGPLAGNLRIVRDTISLDQMQVGYRGGNISGQLVVDALGKSPRMMFRGNITGVRPSKGSEILDANTALSFDLGQLAVEGRVHVVRIDPAHLLEVLDVLDPYRQDPDINKARLGLKVGYPEFMRIRMKDGFVSAKLELGGVAKLVSIQEIRGIPLGPLMNLYVVPLLPEDLLSGAVISADEAGSRSGSGETGNGNEGRSR